MTFHLKLDHIFHIKIGPKPLRIRFDKIDGFIRIYDGTRYLTLFGSEKYDAIYNKIRYLISLETSITYVFSHYFAKIKVDYYDFLPVEKRMENTAKEHIEIWDVNVSNIHFSK